MAADVVITEYTDPGCPWAYSAEPFRLRLEWLYGNAIEWRRRMVVLAEDPQAYLDNEILRESDGVQIAVPGFQPFAAYEVVLANLVPGTERRAAPESVLEVLEWGGAPLATREVAVVRDIDHAKAREELGRVADEEHVGADGLWSASA